MGHLECPYIIGKSHASLRRAVVIADCITQLVEVGSRVIGGFGGPACHEGVRPHFIRDNHDFFSGVIQGAGVRLCNLNHVSFHPFCPLRTSI